ncbi:putative neck protein [Vibrio phage 150E35-1]|nr:putative neck protein [Vibrio phage 150E35-1]
MSNLIEMLEKIRGTLDVDSDVVGNNLAGPALLADKLMEGYLEEERARITGKLYVGQTLETANGRSARIICIDAKIDRGNDDVVALITEPDGTDFIEWYSSKGYESGILTGSGTNLDLIIK